MTMASLRRGDFFAFFFADLFRAEGFLAVDRPGGFRALPFRAQVF
jgi:hypothetical protein